MKKTFISIGLLFVGLYGASITFNHINPWAGLAVTFLVIGVFLNYIYKQIKNYNNEKF
jgi:hypothetical protein